MDLLTSNKKADVFRRLEKLEALVASRAELVATLSTSKVATSDCVEQFRVGRQNFELLIRPPQATNLYQHPNPVNVLPPIRSPSVVPEIKPIRNVDQLDWKVVDATNLCMLFKAFQPFLDRNVPNAQEAACLQSILHPAERPAVYHQFAAQFKKNGNLIKWQGRYRRRYLMVIQQAEEVPNGGVPEAKIRVSGRNGEVTPMAFRKVINYLTEGLADDLMIRSLFQWFDGCDKEDDDAIDLNQFLDTLDNALEDNKTYVTDLCFTHCCPPGGTVISRSYIFEHLVPSGKLTENQAACLIDHFPAEPQLAKVPPPGKRGHEKAKAEHERRVLECFRVGKVMGRKHFGTSFEESPYLTICFLDLILRFAANEFSRTNWNLTRKKRTTLQILGEVWLTPSALRSRDNEEEGE